MVVMYVIRHWWAEVGSWVHLPISNRIEDTTYFAVQFAAEAIGPRGCRESGFQDAAVKMGIVFG